MSHAARAQSLFVAGERGQFGTLNVTTGAYARLGSTTYNNVAITLGGLANAANGNLYGMESNLDQSGAGTMLRLFQVNRANGALSLVGTVGQFIVSNDRQAFAQIGNTSDGTLYATYSPNLFGTNQTLYTLNASSAVATPVGTGDTGFRFDGGLVGDGAGNLFGFSGEFDAPNFSDYSINRTSGAATLLQSNPGGGFGLAAGFTNNNIYTLNYDGGIYALNTTTGVLTNTGRTFDTNMTGALVGAANVTPFATPEPGTLLLLGMGLATGAGIISTTKRSKAKGASKQAV